MHLLYMYDMNANGAQIAFDVMNMVDLSNRYTFYARFSINFYRQYFSV